MASSSSVVQIVLVSDSREAILRIRDVDRVRLEKHLFQRYPNREWGTFFMFGFRRTSWGLALSYAAPILPNAGDLVRQTDITEFAAKYNLRAFRTGRTDRVAIGVAHSHPSGYMTRPSKLDDDMDSYFAQELTHYTGGQPYCSLIFQRNERMGFSFSGRVFDRGEWLPIKTMFTIGDHIDKDTSELCPSKAADAISFGEESPTARLSSLMGRRSAERLRVARVGIVGSGGTGTPVGNTFARAGIGGFVTVDPQRISPSNHERTHTTFRQDLINEDMPYKSALMKRMILAINPAADVAAYVGNSLQDNVIDDMLRCDVVLGCADTIHGRVLLSDLAKHFLLPSIDVAVDMDGKDGKLTSQIIQFTRFSPDCPCAFCYDLVNASDMAAELMTDEERAMREAEAKAAAERGQDPDAYWRNQRQVHTVGYLTSAAGAMAAGYAIGWMTDAFSMPYDAFQLDIGQPHLGVVPIRSQTVDCSCANHLGGADLASEFRNVSRPKHWRRRAMLLP